MKYKISTKTNEDCEADTLSDKQSNKGAQSIRQRTCIRFAKRAVFPAPTTHKKPRVHWAALMRAVTDNNTKATLIAENSVMDNDFDDSKMTVADTAMAMAPDPIAVW